MIEKKVSFALYILPKNQNCSTQYFPKLDLNFEYMLIRLELIQEQLYVGDVHLDMQNYISMTIGSITAANIQQNTNVYSKGGWSDTLL